MEVNTNLYVLKKVEIISSKALTADLKNKHSIFNEAKFYSSDGLQKCFNLYQLDVFIGLVMIVI